MLSEYGLNGYRLICAVLERLDSCVSMTGFVLGR